MRNLQLCEMKRTLVDRACQSWTLKPSKVSLRSFDTIFSRGLTPKNHYSSSWYNWYLCILNLSMDMADIYIRYNSNWERLTSFYFWHSFVIKLYQFVPKMFPSFLLQSNAAITKSVNSADRIYYTGKNFLASPDQGVFIYVKQKQGVSKLSMLI